MKLIKNKALDKEIDKIFCEEMENLILSDSAEKTKEGSFIPTTIASVIYLHQRGFFKHDKSAESWNKLYDSNIENTSRILIAGSNIHKNTVFSTVAKSIAPLYTLN